MRISDWSSDVCSSDLLVRNPTIGDELQPAAMIPGIFDQIIVDDGIEPEFGGDQIEQVPDELPGILRTDQPTRGLREQCQPASMAIKEHRGSTMPHAGKPRLHKGLYRARPRSQARKRAG